MHGATVSHVNIGSNMPSQKKTPTPPPSAAIEAENQSTVEGVDVSAGYLHVSAKNQSGVSDIMVGGKRREPAKTGTSTWLVPLIVGVLGLIGAITAAYITKKC